MVRERAFDLVILGSGSTAFAAALRAQELGKTAVLTEERTLGGTCVNRGCLPSKNLIEAARLVHDARHPRYPGLQPAEMKFDFGQLVVQKDEVVSEYRDRKYKSLLGGKFHLVTGHVQFVDAHTVEVDEQRLRGEKILIATGSRPVVPQIEGLDRVPYLTSDLLTSGEEQELRELPRSLLIIGAGYIALELGQMFRRFGSEVTLIERGEGLLARGYEPEVGPSVAEFLESEGIQIVTRAQVRSVQQDREGILASVQIDGEERQSRAERLLVAAGRRPNSDRIAIERAGVELDEEGAVRVDEYLRTNVPHIFAAGDVIGREAGSQMATPVAATTAASRLAMPFQVRTRGAWTIASYRGPYSSTPR